MAIPANRDVKQKRRKKETTVQESIYRDTKSVEYELCDYTGNNLSH